MACDYFGFVALITTVICVLVSVLKTVNLNSINHTLNKQRFCEATNEDNIDKEQFHSRHSVAQWDVYYHILDSSIPRLVTQPPRDALRTFGLDLDICRENSNRYSINHCIDT